MPSLSYKDNPLLSQIVINHAPLRDKKRLSAVFRDHSYPIFEALTRENRMVTTNGTELKVFMDSGFGGVDEISDVDPEITYKTNDNPSTVTYPWAGTNTSWVIGDMERATARESASRVRGNSKAAQEERAQIITDFVNARRFTAIRLIPEGLETRAWAPKDSADIERRHLGIFDFARMAPNGAGPGTADYLGFTRRFGDSGWKTGMATKTMIGGQDASLAKNEHLRNYTVVYDESEFGGSKFFNSFELMRLKMNFNPPSNVKDLVTSPVNNWAIYCGTDLWIRLSEQQRTGGQSYGLTRVGTDIFWLGIPLIEAPRLTGHPFMPFVWINWAYWKFHTREGRWMEEIVKDIASNPTLELVAVINEYQPVCENVRYGCGVMHTVVS